MFGMPAKEDLPSPSFRHERETSQERSANVVSFKYPPDKKEKQLWDK